LIIPRIDKKKGKTALASVCHLFNKFFLKVHAVVNVHTYDPVIIINSSQRRVRNEISSGRSPPTIDVFKYILTRCKLMDTKAMILPFWQATTFTTSAILGKQKFKRF
jgi:hypothetical protein